MFQWINQSRQYIFSLYSGKLSEFILIFKNIFFIHVNNLLNLTYSSSFNMTHKSLSTLLLKLTAWKDFSTVTAPDFCGLVSCLFHGAVCQWCTWADTDDSLGFTCASRSLSSNQTKITPNNSYTRSWDGHLYHMHVSREERGFIYISTSQVFY